MTAQAIQDVISPSMNLLNYNQTLKESESFLITEKVNIATTLALLVGLVQVNFENYENLIYFLLCS